MSLLLQRQAVKAWLSPHSASHQKGGQEVPSSTHKQMLHYLFWGGLSLHAEIHFRMVWGSYSIPAGVTTACLLLALIALTKLYYAG